MGKFNTGYFTGGTNIYLNLITYIDKMIIQSILQRYVFHWYHTHLALPGMHIMESMTHNNVWWTGIRNDVHKEVTNCDTWQRTKRLNNNMLNYQLSKLRKCHWKNMYKYNRYVRHKKNRNERNFYINSFTTRNPVRG